MGWILYSVAVLTVTAAVVIYASLCTGSDADDRMEELARAKGWVK